LSSLYYFFIVFRNLQKCVISFFQHNQEPYLSFTSLTKFVFVLNLPSVINPLHFSELLLKPITFLRIATQQWRLHEICFRSLTLLNVA